VARASRQHNGYGNQLHLPELGVSYDLSVEHPSHEREIGAHRRKSLTHAAEMINGHVLQHLIPCTRWVVLPRLVEHPIAQKACGSCWTWLATEMGKNVCLVLPDITKVFLAVKDLKRADQVCIGSADIRYFERSIDRF